MQYHTYFWELIRFSYLTSCYFPKIAKKHTVLFLFSTLNDGNAFVDACCCFSTPSIYNLSIFLDEGILIIFGTEKARLW
jgi:hypothetical protein